MVAWRSNYQDGVDIGVFAQRLAVAALATLDVDGNGVLRRRSPTVCSCCAPASASAAPSLTTSAVGDDCTRCEQRGRSWPTSTGSGLTLDIDDDGTVQPLTDGLLILRFLFGFTGTTLTGGAVDARLRSLRRGRYSSLPPDLGLTPRGPSRSSPVGDKVMRNLEGEHLSSKLSVARTVVMSAITLIAAQAVPAQLLVRVGVEFQVNTYTTGDQTLPAVAANGPGFVLVWSSTRDGSFHGIFGQRFSSGGAQGGEFQINAYTEGEQYRPRVAADSVGNFVVVWQSTGQDGDSRGVFGHRFDSSGAPLGGEFQVNSFTVGYQGAMDVAAEADGDFVVVWSSYLQDDFFSGVFGRRFSSAGVPQATEFQINASTTASEYVSAVGIQSDGHFVVTWASAQVGGGSLDIFARRFDSAGTPQGVFQVNTYTIPPSTTHTSRSRPMATS